MRKLVLPVELSQIYYDPDVWSFSSTHFSLPLIAVCVVAVGLGIWAFKSRQVTLPVILLALSLIPPLVGVSIFPRHDLVHNRYLYLPSAAACMLFSLALRKATDPGMKFIKAKSVTVIVFAFSLALIFPIRSEEEPYHDNIALFSRSVERAPQSAMGSPPVTSSDRVQREQAAAANAQRQVEIRRDTDKMAELTEELKEYLAKNDHGR